MGALLDVCGFKGSVHYLRVFGCRAHVKITRPGLQKLDDTTEACPQSFSGDVVFNEGRAWDWKSTIEPVVTSEFTVEDMDYGGAASLLSRQQLQIKSSHDN
jgi:hypothetical protein